MLAIESPAEYSDVVTGMQFHAHKPYASATFKNNDEIRIPVSQQDVITAPFESSLHISGTLSGKKADGITEAKVALVNNAIAFLFDDIRYEISGIPIDRNKNVGITSTMKSLLSMREDDKNNLINACWLGPGNTEEVTKFTFDIPLRTLLGFAEDYRRIVVNVKQELILLRSATDVNAITSAEAATATLTITDLYWRVPHVSVSDNVRLKLLNKIEKDTTVHLPFRSWELHEYPTLPQTKKQSWTVKTSTQLEKPRYVILAFQTDRKGDIKKDMSCFDHCKLTDVKLYLNSQYYPYDNVRGDMSIFYDMFTRFQSSYYDRPGSSMVGISTFKNKAPLYVIDCSKQNDSVKSGPIDVRLELEVEENFPSNTTAYCLLLHDAHLTYTLLTGTVKNAL